MEKHVSPPKLAKLLDVSEMTVYNWIKNGTIRAKRVGNRWAIPVSQFENLQEENESNNSCIIYARVSGNLQKDLNNQVSVCKQYAVSRGYTVKDIIIDKASSFNFKRKGLQKLLDYVITRKVNKVIIYSKDRLSRIAYDFFEVLFSKFDVEIEVIDNSDHLEDWQMKDLVNELISFFHYITSKFYGLRSYKKKFKELENELKNYKNSNN